MFVYLFSDELLDDDELKTIAQSFRVAPRKKPPAHSPFSYNPNPITDDDIIKLATKINISIQGLRRIMDDDYR